MQATDAIAATLKTSNMVLRSYVSDFSDAELMRCPGEGCHPIAWQLGHLISSSGDLLNSVCPGHAIELPTGFKEAHTKEMADNTDAAKFFSKNVYLDLLDKTEQATITAFGTMTPEALDQPAPEHFRSMFPTVGDVCILIASHGMMHAGQFVPVRRALGKPVVI